MTKITSDSYFQCIHTYVTEQSDFQEQCCLLLFEYNLFQDLTVKFLFEKLNITKLKPHGGTHGARILSTFRNRNLEQKVSCGILYTALIYDNMMIRC